MGMCSALLVSGYSDELYSMQIADVRSEVDVGRCGWL